MSGHYSASQFNEPFKARRLRNWMYGINNPGKHPVKRCGSTCFIANENGYLLSHIPRNASTSPWGDYRDWIWEETPPCTCTDRIRRSEEYDRPPCSILVTRERPKKRAEAKETAATMAKNLFRSRPPPEVATEIIHPPEGANQDSRLCSDSPRQIPPSDVHGNKANGEPGVNVGLNPESFQKGATVDVDASLAQPGVCLSIDASKCLPDGAFMNLDTTKMGISGINVDVNLKDDKKGKFIQEQF